MIKKYQEWAKREFSEGQRILALVPLGFLFLLVLPYLLVISSNALDQLFHLPKVTAGILNPVLGLLLAIGGFSLGFWSVNTQMTLGKGTPVPMMPTHKLIVRGPFAYCRNPMTLGTILGYFGIAVWAGSISALAIIWLLAVLLLTYIKRVEERELEQRFGVEYLEYRQSTPFILPRLRPR